MAEELKLAFVGCGAISQLHLFGIEDGKAPIRVTAAVDPDRAKAEEVAAKTGATVFTSFEEALANGDFDAVDLMLPHDLHEAIALQAFAAGKHVLLEKPMAPTLDACDRILDRARRAGTVFLVAENAQYWPEAVTTRQLIEDGAIGDVVTARSTLFFAPLGMFYGGERPWRFDRKVTGGGIAVDAGSHWIRPLRMWLGEIDEVVAALGYPFGRMEGESLVHALCRFRSGVVANFDALLTEATLGPDVLFRITGSQGEITVDIAGRVLLYDSEHRQGRQIGATEGYLNSYRGELLDFAAAVLEGKRPLADAAYSLGELRAALAMYRSAESGRWEKVWE